MKLILAAIMCPTFCMEEPPPLCEVEQVCVTKDKDFPILTIPLASTNLHVPCVSPSHPLPENLPTAVVPEPSSLAIMDLVGVIGLLTMRKRVCHNQMHH